MQYTQAAAARLLGRPPLFALAPPDLNGCQSSLFQVGAMRALVNELVDFQRLNSGDIRVSILTVDLETGSEVAFDTARDRVGIDHVMASAAFVPDFPAVEINGRFLVDGGLSANLPLHLILASDGADTAPVSTCFAIDLFPSAANRPLTVLQGLQRQTDLMFSSQSMRTLAHLRDLWVGRVPGCRIFYMAYQAIDDEVALKGFDFSETSLKRRAKRGEHAMTRQIDAWRKFADPIHGLSIHQL